MFGQDRDKIRAEAMSAMIKQVAAEAARQVAAEASPEQDMQRCRAASVTVGTAFGGTTEVSMRSNYGGYLYSILQPVEVIELIHQLAANVGCHLALKPREDFASWRGWEMTEEDLLHFRGLSSLASPHFSGSGHAPHALPQQPEKGTTDPALSNKQQLKLKANSKDSINTTIDDSKENHDNAVATKKTVDKRSTKRSRSTTK